MRKLIRGEHLLEDVRSEALVSYVSLCAVRTSSHPRLLGPKREVISDESLTTIAVRSLRSMLDSSSLGCWFCILVLDQYGLDSHSNTTRYQNRVFFSTAASRHVISFTLPVPVKLRSWECMALRNNRRGGIEWGCRGPFGVGP